MSAPPVPKVSRSKRFRVLPLLLVLLACVLAGASFVTTGGGGIAEGSFPAGEYHLSIHNESGKPIQGAVLNIYQGNTHAPALRYPIDNYLTTNSLISDTNGQIVALHEFRGFEFGEPTTWRLFWVIPIAYSNTPEFYGEITAEGYQSETIPVTRLFETASATHAGNSGQAGMPVYKQTIVLYEK